MDYVEKSFASAAEASKLLITLATGLIAFCVAVVNLKAADATILTPLPGAQTWFLGSSWLLLLASVGVGVWTQLAITDVLANATDEAPPSAWNRKITFPFIWQIVTFFLGVLALTTYGVLRLAG